MANIKWNDLHAVTLDKEVYVSRSDIIKNLLQITNEVYKEKVAAIESGDDVSEIRADAQIEVLEGLNNDLQSITWNWPKLNDLD